MVTNYAKHENSIYPIYAGISQLTRQAYVLFYYFFDRADIVGYEENDPRVTSKLNLGYPRFKFHAALGFLYDEFLSRTQSKS